MRPPHLQTVESLAHNHAFLGEHHAANERRTWLAVGLTLVMMVAEIIGGTIYGSMALLADGWHMSTHAAALGIAGLAYRYARRHVHDPRFAFGTGKLGELAAYTSAIVLAIIALLIGYESLLRIASPIPIAYGEALTVAVIGLAVNLICAWLLRDNHAHDHDRSGHTHDHDHSHHHRDNNLRAAYAHVLADAATSVLAIGGLIVARAFNWVWIDPVVGIIGACVIASWAYGLLRDTGAVLVDLVPDQKLERDVRQALERDGDRVCDLHLWQLGPGHHAAIVSLVSDHPKTPSFYKARLRTVKTLSHVTIEVSPCDDPDCLATS